MPKQEKAAGGSEPHPDKSRRPLQTTGNIFRYRRERAGGGCTHRNTGGGETLEFGEWKHIQHKDALGAPPLPWEVGNNTLA